MQKVFLPNTEGQACTHSILPIFTTMQTVARPTAGTTNNILTRKRKGTELLT